MKKRIILLLIICTIFIVTACSFTNQPPFLDEIGDKTVTVGNTLSFKIYPSDPDGDILIASISPDKFEDFIVVERGIFEWAPTTDDIGEHQVTFKVVDGQAADGETITITVDNENRSPKVIGITDQEIAEGSQLGPLTLKATDEDNDELRWEIVSGPGEIINNSQYVWQPTYTDSGEYHVSLSVSDGKGGTDVFTFGITVNDTNRSPQIANIADQVIDEG